uniref:IncF plasmid conjugative transfer protein TrbB n=1 Tax=Vibrio tasmaniensis TaxID=212663 RepID=A0A0H3ZQA5_9VIBR|nr:IncF plasmid conjugative transfer protein TrbB [Vibrio tasmaniensis]
MTRLIHTLLLSGLLLSGFAHAATAKEAMQQMMTSAPPTATALSPVAHAAPARSEWTLVFVFADWCPYCHRTAPVVKAWAANHHIQVRAISTTGKGLPDYPTPERLSEQDKAQWFHGNIRVPALLAQRTGDPKRIQGMASGAVTDAQLTALWQQTMQRLQPFGDKS